jgi:hypothetical protein
MLTFAAAQIPMHDEGLFMADLVRVQVLMSPEEAGRFEAYCLNRGFKKSPLIARLIRDHLANEHFAQQQPLFESSDEMGSRNQ